MHNFFNPKSIAIIGASDKRGKVGYSLVQNLKSFKGQTYYINIKRKKIQGKKCYKSILEIKSKIDLVLIAIPAIAVSEALIECGKKNIKNVIIISAGFGEVGNKELESKIIDIAKKYKIRILGPNCISGDSSILITNGNMIKYKQIGPLVNDLLNIHKDKIFNISGTLVLDLKYHNKELNVLSYCNGKIVKKRITKVMKRIANKVIKITCDGGHEIICSEDHPFLIKRNAGLIKMNASKLKGNELIPIVKHLNFNNDILMNMNLIEEFKKLPLSLRRDIKVKFENKTYTIDEIGKLQDFDINKVGLCVKWGQISLPAILEISEELCKLIGFFIADGNYKKDCLRIGYIDCREAEREIRNCINKVFGSNLVDLSNCKDIKFGGKIGKILFKNIFQIGEGALNKTIPDFIYNTSEKNAIAFLSGLYSGDGCIYKYKNKPKSILTIGFVSKKLIDQLYHLFNILNLGPFYRRFAIRREAHKIRNKMIKETKQYILRTDSSQVIKNLYKKGFRFLVKNKNDVLNEIVNNGYNFPSRENNQIYFRKIKNIEFINKPLALYDFEVEDSHNFIVNHILSSNCFGVVNPHINLDTTFAKTRVNKGGISFISQSGALWSAISDYSVKENFGFSKFAALGNMTDVSFEDLILYLDQDKLTKVIVLYIEVLRDGRKFMDIVKKCKKPIIAIKAGRSESGIKATLSHTGSLAGSYEIYKSAFRQCGVKLVDNITEAFDLARFLEKEKINGNRVVIVTNAGGPGVLCADYCEEIKLNVVNLEKKFTDGLKLNIPWSRRNPIDLVGDAMSDRYKEVFDKLSKENFYDILICVLTPQNMTDIEKIASELINFKKKSHKNVVACFMGGNSIKKAKELLNKNGILCFKEPKRIEFLRLR